MSANVTTKTYVQTYVDRVHRLAYEAEHDPNISHFDLAVVTQALRRCHDDLRRRHRMGTDA